jgi:hypothetical protein
MDREMEVREEREDEGILEECLRGESPIVRVALDLSWPRRLRFSAKMLDMEEEAFSMEGEGVDTVGVSNGLTYSEGIFGLRDMCVMKTEEGEEGGGGEEGEGEGEREEGEGDDTSLILFCPKFSPTVQM